MQCVWSQVCKNKVSEKPHDSSQRHKTVCLRGLRGSRQDSRYSEAAQEEAAQPADACPQERSGERGAAAERGHRPRPRHHRRGSPAARPAAARHDRGQRRRAAAAPGHLHLQHQHRASPGPEIDWINNQRSNYFTKNLNMESLSIVSITGIHDCNLFVQRNM